MKHMQGFLLGFAICPQWGASCSCSGQTDSFSFCFLPALLLLPIGGGGEEPCSSAVCLTCSPGCALISHMRTGCTSADQWSVQPSKQSLTVAISRHQGKSNKRAIKYTFLILSKSPAVFSSEISWPCCCLISSLLWILLLITSAVFPWALWIAPTPSFVIEIYCLMHGTTSFCLFWVWFLLPYWIFYQKIYGFLYPRNTIFFPNRIILFHASYGSCSLPLTKYE